MVEEEGGEEVKEVWVNMVRQIKCSQPWPQLRPPPKQQKKMLSTKIKPRSFSLTPKTTPPMSLSQELTDRELPQKAP